MYRFTDKFNAKLCHPVVIAIKIIRMEKKENASTGLVPDTGLLIRADCLCQQE